MVEAGGDLSILQRKMKGLVNQIDAHHREDDARRERGQGGNDGMEGVFVEEVDSGEEVGVQAEGGQKRKMGKDRFGGGSSSARGIRRNMGPHGGDDVSSVEGVLKIRLKHLVFEILKPDEKCLRSAFFLLAQGQGKMEIKKMMMQKMFGSRFSQESRFKVRGDEFAVSAGCSGPLVVWAWLLLLDARRD